MSQEKTSDGMEGKDSPDSKQGKQSLPAKSDKQAEKSSKPEDKSTKKKDKPSAKKEAGKTPAQNPPARKSPSGWLTGVASVLAIIALMFAGYNYWLLERQTADLQQQLQNQSRLSQQVDTQQAGLDVLQTSVEAEKQARQELVAEQRALSRAWENMESTLGRNSMAWQLAEVEYLLSIANHRSQLMKDKDTALNILKSADNRLLALGDPRLLPVREQIAHEITALQSLPEVDTTGIALKLSSLITQVDELPLIDTDRLEKVVEQETPAVASSWRELPAVIWGQIKSLVQIRRHEQSIESLLPPQQSTYLYRNLSLKLEVARLAVLQKNTMLYHSQLQEALQWLEEFFDKEAASVKGSKQSLQALINKELDPMMPDISGSLRGLREFMAKQQQPVMGDNS